jgi:nicotinate phosphoribosyltransferase
MTFFTPHQIKKIKEGYYSAVYFNRTKHILEKENDETDVVMQVFQRREKAFLCGVEEVKELFKLAMGNGQWAKIKLDSKKDGEWVKAFSPVMHIKGPYAYFAHLESVYLGILARRTLVATNTRLAVEAAHGKPVMFFADRFDYFLNQEGDGYAAHIGGAAGVCTEAHAKWWNGIPVGTLPHALIAVCRGDTIKAAELFSKYYPSVNLISLVDFDNDCVKTALELAKRLGKKLYGIRIDTAGNMVDRSLVLQTSPQPSPMRRGIKREVYGVNPRLVKLVRKALDQDGFSHVKIAVSGGFDHEKIARFEKEKTPVDIYGVGSSLLKGSNDFTADIVKVGEKKIAKSGRGFQFL